MKNNIEESLFDKTQNPQTQSASTNHSQFVGSIPEVYDRHLGPLLFEFSAADLAERIARRAPDARKILEVACGTGISTLHLWRTLHEDTTILATDLNPAMLEYARDSRGSMKNVLFQQADAQNLDLEDCAFDALVCQFGIMFFTDKPAAFSEFARVLKPGSTLAFNVWGSLGENPVAAIAHETISGFFTNNPPKFLTTPFGFNEIDPIQRLLTDAGFEKVEVATVEATVERPSALSVARGFVEGNPGILEIQERATADAEDIVIAVAEAIELVYGREKLQVPLKETTFVATRL